MTEIKQLFIMLFLMLFPAAVLQAAPQAFLQKVDQPFSGSQSPDDARIAALAKAKIQALEQAGTYIESHTVVENYRIQKDEITAFAAGIVHTQIISQQNYATKNGFGLILRIRLEVDTSLFEKRLAQLIQDRSLREKYNEIQAREKELLARIENLEKQNRLLRETPRSAHWVEKETIQDTYHQTIQALSAAEWNRKAVALWANSRFTDPKKAIAYLDRSLRLDPENPQSFNNRGSAYYQLGRLDLALSDFQTAIRMDPSYAAAYNNLGIVCFHQQQYDQAVTHFTQAICLAPDNVKPYLFRAAAYKNLYQYQKALNDFSEVRRLSPDYKTQAAYQDSIFLELDELERICRNAARACRLGLCRAMDYLRDKGFCHPECLRDFR